VTESNGAPTARQLVVETLLRRPTVPKAGTDAPVKTALVIQGGGTRAITSCSAAAALDALGLRSAFDAVFAASSGAVNAAYFLAGQAALGVDVYLKDISTRRFLNPLRWPRVMDLDYLFTSVVRDAKRHDLRAFLVQPTPLHVLATDGATGEAVWFDSKRMPRRLYSILKATCSLPLASKPVVLNNRRLLDGMFAEPIPILRPIELGFTHVLLLHTRDLGYRTPSRPRGVVERVVDVLMRRDLSPAVYAQYRTEPERFNQLSNLIESGTVKSDAGRTVRIACAYPSGVSNMDRFERNREALYAAGYTSWKAVMDMFGHVGPLSTAEAYREIVSAAGRVERPR